MARIVATEKSVDVEGLLEFVQPRHQWILATARSDGRPQMSPVTGGVTAEGKLVVSTYPQRDKVHNIRRSPDVTVCVMSDHFGGAWVQIDGSATVVDLPEAMDGLVDYFRSISGEHPDWDDYRAAMERQGKCLIVIDPQRWGPLATGGFPAPVVKLLDELDDAPADLDGAPAGSDPDPDPAESSDDAPLTGFNTEPVAEPPVETNAEPDNGSGAEADDGPGAESDDGPGMDIAGFAD